MENTKQKFFCHQEKPLVCFNRNLIHGYPPPDHNSCYTKEIRCSCKTVWVALGWECDGGGRLYPKSKQRNWFVAVPSIQIKNRVGGFTKQIFLKNPEKETNPNLSSPETKQRQNACIEVTTKHLKRSLAANLHVTEVPTVPWKYFAWQCLEEMSKWREMTAKVRYHSCVLHVQILVF